MNDARDRRLEIAADWAAQSESGSLPEALQAELDSWLGDPENQEAFDAVRDTWHVLGVLQGSPELDELKAAAPALPTITERRPSLWPWLATAAAVCLAAVVAVIWTRMGPAVHETRIGELTVVELADGTVVHLDTDTRIVSSFRRDRRVVTLERGRALFDVVRDPARPFVVRSADVSVTALGTQFDVYRRDGATDVAVVEGKVNVRRVRGASPIAAGPESDGTDLVRGQLARVATGAAGIHVEPVDIQSVLVWTTGRIEFDLTPLPDAIAAFNRYSRYPMRLADPALASIRVSGVFRFDETEAFRASLARSAPVQSHRSADGTILITSSTGH